MGLSAALAACSASSKDKKKADDEEEPLISGGRVQGVTTFTPSSTKAAEARYEPGADATIAIWKSKLTLPDGWLAEPADLTLQLIQGGLVATSDLVPLSPLLAFKATLDDGALVERPALVKSIVVETVIDRRVDAAKIVGLLILDAGLATEARYAIPPTELTFAEQADGSTIVSFPTRDTEFRFAVAASTKGLTPAGYATYPSMPPDSEDLIAESTGTDDQPAEARLSWTPPAKGSRTGYRLSVGYDGATPDVGCKDGAVLEPALVTSERKTFPIAVSIDRYVARALEDAKALSVRLCSLNGRTPPDASDGIVATFQLPTRAKATLTGTPDAYSNVTSLAVNVGGIGVTAYRYAVVSTVDECAAATYGEWIDAATAISDTVVEGARTLCVLGRLSETNEQSTATTYAWTQDVTAPAAFTIAAVTTPSSVTRPSIAWDAADGTSSYRVTVTTDAACTAAVQGVDTGSTTFQPTALADGVYYACVTASDLAGNATAATNQGVAFEVDTTPPVFTSLALQNETADGYLNATDHTLSHALAGALVATGATIDQYTVLSASLACSDVTTGWSSMPLQNDSALATDGSYKVCVKLSDPSGNVTIGASADFVLKTTLPAFTALLREGDAADGFINAVEHATTNALAGSLTATSYDAAAYALTTDGTPCDASLTYGSMPLSNSTVFVAETNYIVCVKLTDNAANEPDYGWTSPFAYDITPPAFTSLALANGALDTYVNVTDHGSATAIAGALVAGPYAAATYALTTAATSCSDVLTYGGAPLLTSTVFTTDGAYKVCVKLVDAAGNPRYGATSTTTLDLSPPEFTSFALAGDVADNYLNAVERGNSTALAGTLVAANHDTAAYALAPSATACDQVVTYGAMPQSNSADFGANGLYKVCVELSDAANNAKAYGSTADFTLDTVAPVMQSVSATEGNLSFRATDVLHITATFDEAVVVGGSGAPTLALDTGGTDRLAVYSSVAGDTTTGTTVLTFLYTVQAGDNISPLATHPTGPQIDLGTATLKDAAGNPISLTVAGTALSSNKNMTIDTTAPGAFTITTAATVTDDTPDMTWSDPGGVNTFDVLVSTTSGCGTALQTFASVSGLSQTLTTLPSGAYYVCVTARDNAGNTTAATNNDFAFTVALGAWAATPTLAEPAARRGARAVWNGASKVIVWGGLGALTSYLGDGGVLDFSGSPAVWTATDELDPHCPTGRIDFTATWAGDRMFVFGGFDGAAVTATGASFIPGDADPWRAMVVTGDPATARRDHTAVWDTENLRVIIFGGTDASDAPLDTGSAYDPTGTPWVAVDISELDHAEARAKHTAVWTGTKMLVWGGIGTDGVDALVLNTGSIYHPAGVAPNVWNAITTDDAPSARWGHAAFWDDVALRMVVFGGFDENGNALHDGGLYDPLLNAWSPLADLGMSHKRGNFAAVWDTGAKRMLTFGGFNGTAALATGAAYKPGLNTWTIPTLEPVGVPLARYDAAAVWVGTKMLIFGGYDSGLISGGAFYTPP